MWRRGNSFGRAMRSGLAAGARPDLGRLSRCPKPTSASCKIGRRSSWPSTPIRASCSRARSSRSTPRRQDTRTLLVRGRLPNPDRKLLPGMFANVAVLAGGPKDRHRAAHGGDLQPLRRQRLRGEGRRAGARRRRRAASEPARGRGRCHARSTADRSSPSSAASCTRAGARRTAWPSSTASRRASRWSPAASSSCNPAPPSRSTIRSALKPPAERPKQ